MVDSCTIVLVVASPLFKIYFTPLDNKIQFQTPCKIFTFSSIFSWRNWLPSSRNSLISAAALAKSVSVPLPVESPEADVAEILDSFREDPSLFNKEAKIERNRGKLLDFLTIVFLVKNLTGRLTNSRSR